jgi:hypothetical protein
MLNEELMHRKLNMLFEPFNIYFEHTRTSHPMLENTTVTKYTAIRSFSKSGHPFVRPVGMSSGFYNWLYACELDKLFFMPILILLKNNKISYFGELKC